MYIRHLGMAPTVHPEAYVAPTAILSGDVRIDRGTCIMHGAVVAAEGGAVVIGANCVIMENAVLRGTPQNQLAMGDHVLVGPHSHLTGCGISDEVFIATGAKVFNGAHVGRASSVALGAVVHIGCIVPPLTRIPIGWVAVGEPARIYPPNEVEEIRAGLAEVGGGSCRTYSASTTTPAATSRCKPRSCVTPGPWPVITAKTRSSPARRALTSSSAEGEAVDTIGLG